MNPGTVQKFLLDRLGDCFRLGVICMQQRER